MMKRCALILGSLLLAVATAGAQADCGTGDDSKCGVVYFNPTPTAIGSAYVQGDVGSYLTLVCGATAQIAQVNNGSGTGGVTKVLEMPGVPGFGCTTGVGKTTTGGSGSGATLNLTVNNPYASHGGWPPAHTTIDYTLGCQTVTPANNTYYLLNGNIGSDLTATCLTLSGADTHTGWTVDLGGYTVTGTFMFNGMNSGATILNGTVHCLRADNYDCMKGYISSGAPPSPEAHLQFLFIVNDYTGTAQSRSLWVTDYSNICSGAPTTKCLEIDHIQTVVPGNSQSPRATGISDVVNGSASSAVSSGHWIHHNFIYSNGLSHSAFGIAPYRLQGSIIENNYINFATTAQAHGRLIVWEDVQTSITQPTEFRYNHLVANNNVAIRVWAPEPASSANAFLVHDNVIDHISIGDRTAGIQLGEQGSLQNLNGLTTYNNTLDLVGGHGVSVSGATNVIVHDETFTCSAGCTSGFYAVRTDVSELDATGASMTTYHNTVTPLTSAGLPAVMVCAGPSPPGTVAYDCGIGNLSVTSSATVGCTGTVVGNGSITLNNGLPGCSAPGSPAVQLAPANLIFAGILLGQSSTAQTVVLTNTGTATLNISGLAVTSTSPVPQYSITTTCGSTLTAGSSCNIVVTFSPTTGGNQTGTVGLSSNDPVTPYATVMLAGTGSTQVNWNNATLGNAAMSP
jgi:hypothetical protein